MCFKETGSEAKVMMILSHQPLIILRTCFFICGYSSQPAVHPTSGNVLLWNGEMYAGCFGSHDDNDGEVEVLPPNLMENDTEVVLEALEERMKKLKSCDDLSTVSAHVRYVLDCTTTCQGLSSYAVFSILLDAYLQGCLVRN